MERYFQQNLYENHKDNTARKNTETKAGDVIRIDKGKDIKYICIHYSAHVT